jgi:hypothetical protein
MIARINKLRRDPRMVAPLTIVALIVVGYVAKQAVPSGPAPKVQVEEVRPRAAAAADTDGPSATSDLGRDPYFHEALAGVANVAFQAPEPRIGEDGSGLSLPPGLSGLGGVMGRQAANLAALAQAQQRRIQSEIEAMERPLSDTYLPGREEERPPFATAGGAGPGLLAPIEVLAGTREPTTETQSPIPEPEPLPDLPGYRLVAVLAGKPSMAVLIDEQGSTIYARHGETLPSGEELRLLSDREAALLGERLSRILYLGEGAMK